MKAINTIVKEKKMTKKSFTVLVLLAVIGVTVFGQTLKDHLDRATAFYQ